MDQPFALIIEDERDIAALFRHLMDMSGYRTEVALHGQVAIERLSISRPDIVLLDMNLPGVSGNKILERIRKDRRLIHTKVVVVTAQSYVADGLSREPDLVLQKPVSIEQFSELIKRFELTIKKSRTLPIKDMPWDAVTGLYNQSFFINRLNFSLRRTEEMAQCLFAVISITLDQNDSVKNQLDLKHWISILRETAKTIGNTIRPTDTLARFYQDSFYILIENVPNKDIPRQIASRIKERLFRQLADSASGLLFPIRIGVLLCDSHYKNAEQVLHEVDTARSLANLQEVCFYNDLEMPTKQD